MIQLWPDPRTVSQASSQYWTQVSISTSRGVIRDSRGAALAMSVPATSLFIDPQYWDPANAPELKAALKNLVSASDLAKFSKPMKGRFVWVARKLSPDLAARLLSKKLDGLYALKERKRVTRKGLYWLRSSVSVTSTMKAWLAWSSHGRIFSIHLPRPRYWRGMLPGKESTSCLCRGLQKR